MLSFAQFASLPWKLPSASGIYSKKKKEFRYSQLIQHIFCHQETWEMITQFLIYRILFTEFYRGKYNTLWKPKIKVEKLNSINLGYRINLG